MRLPGFSSAPSPPPPPPPPPTAEDPAIQQAKDKLRLSELNRRGRSASMMNGGSGVTDEAPLGRPAASGSNTGTLG